MDRLVQIQSRFRRRRRAIYVALAVMLLCANGATAMAQGRVPQRLGPRMQRLLEQQRQAENAQPAAPAPPAIDGLGPWLKRLHESVPTSAAAFGDLELPALTEAARAVEQWVLQWGWIAPGQRPEEQIAIVGRLLDTKSTIDRQLDDLLARRVDFANLPADEKRHAALRGYLRAASALVDLSGRVRYALVDIIDDVAGRLFERPEMRERLFDLLADRRSTIGARVLIVDLFDAPATSPDRPPPLPMNQKLKLIRLATVAGTIELVDELAEFVLADSTPPTLVLAAAEAIRALGLPQDPRPGQDSALPQPAITAAKLRERLTKIDPSKWKPEERPRLEALMAWLSARQASGLESNSYRLGHFDVQPGDWLLMRNPSPYNLFTDLSPGLFTHVGVVAMETASDGKRRMVVVDLPERGAAMPATNVEAFLNRTLNYVFVRHPDPALAAKMGEAAAATIGNPTEFDLNFRTDRVAELKGKLLHGQKIHTYCAGFLLLCAQETGLPRELFFPITEVTAGGHTKENIGKLGLSLGKGFISPTGALFSPQLTIVARNEPSYDPQREIEEAIFDHFALGLEQKTLNASPDLFQTLRLKMAEAAKNNPLLAKAIAASAGVNDQMDLVSAAKAAAVVETLDEVSFGASREFIDARRAIMEGGNLTPEQRRALTPEQRQGVEKYRARHANLATRWDRGMLSPRELRIELVKYYSDLGRRQLDERFFRGEN